MNRTRSQVTKMQAELAAWEQYRAAALAMRDRPTPANERAAALYRVRYLTEAMKEA